MESALFKFLTRRQVFCKSALDMVYVKSMGGGAVNKCFGNAYDQLSQHGTTIVSGWLAEPLQTVQPIQHSKVQRQFTQHCGTLTVRVVNTSIHRLRSNKGLFTFWTETLHCSQSTILSVFLAVFLVLLFS
jgi:hypothetical protein